MTCSGPILAGLNSDVRLIESKDPLHILRQHLQQGSTEDFEFVQFLLLHHADFREEGGEVGRGG